MVVDASDFRVAIRVDSLDNTIALDRVEVLAVLGDNVFMYKPDAYEIFNSINDSGCYDKCIVYLDEIDDYMYDLEDYMREELNTNFINYVDENQLATE